MAKVRAQQRCSGCVFGHMHAQRDTAPVGELDGIAQQLQHHLRQPALIARKKTFGLRLVGE